MKIKFIVLSATLISASFVTSAQSTIKDEQTFKSLIKQMTDAQTAYDGAALDKIFALDYIEVSPVGALDPREKVLGFYTPKAKEEAGDNLISLEANDYSIRSYDKFAIAIVQFTYILRNEGRPMPPRSMRVTIVFRKEKNSWKIASSQYTGIRTPLPQRPN